MRPCVFLLTALLLLQQHVSHAAITVVVNPSAVDASGNRNNCGPPTYTSALCNLRSAWEYCTQVTEWINTDSECIISTNSSEQISILDSFGSFASLDNIEPENKTFKITLLGTGPAKTKIVGEGGIQLIDLQYESHGPASSVGYLTMKNVLFNGFGNYNDDTNGAIRISGFKDVTFENVTFKSCESSFGGALYLSSNTDVLINNGRFLDNEVKGNSGHGGAVYATGVTNLNISSTTFKGNHAIQFGGALYVTSTATSLVVLNSVFDSNAADIEGGGFYLGPSNFGVSISGCSFSSNTVPSSGGLGGGMFHAGLTVDTSLTDSVFEYNTGSAGGGIYIAELATGFTMSGVTFSSNEVKEHGGALYAYTGSGFVANDVSVLNNEAQKIGAGFHFEASAVSVSIANSYFYGNEASFIGGAMYFGSDNDKVTLTNIEEKTAGFRGGGIVMGVLMSDVVITDSVFVGNNGGLYGGAMFIGNLGNNITVNNCSMSSNVANFGAGMVFGQKNSDIVVRGSTFDSNVAQASAGGIMFDTFNSGVLIDECKFESNSALQIGGGIGFSNLNKNVIVQDSAFTLNRADDGGAVAFASYGSSYAMDNCSFTHNKADSVGGAIYVAASNNYTQVKGSSFFNNSGSLGGAIFFDSFNTAVTVSTSVFTENFATSDGSGEGGGAIYTNNENYLTVSDSSFTGNYAYFFGGALLAAKSNSLTINRVLFDSNYVVGYVDGSLFTENTAIGGAMYIESDTKALDISYSNFTGNLATWEGASCGAISLLSESNAKIEYTRFHSNAAFSSGGALCFTRAEQVEILHSQFMYNKQTSSDTYSGELGGGAIYIYDIGAHMDNDYLHITNNTFYGNYAGLRGSVMYSTLSAVMSTNNTYQNNTAASLGGALYSHITVTNFMMDSPAYVSNGDVFINNSAVYGADFATQAVKIKSKDNITVISIFDRVQYIPTIYLMDYYDNIVSGNFGGDFGTGQVGVSYTAAAESNYFGCGGSTGSVSGSATAFSSDGTATFPDLLPSCEPGGSIYITFSLLSSDYVDFSLASSNMDPGYAFLEMSFRECVAGEYYSAGSCVRCSNGTYSLALDTPDYKKTTCATAPANSVTDLTYGNVIHAQPAYWRINYMASTLLACPYGANACPGGTTAGNDSCVTGYEGPLCSVCSPNYYFDSTAVTCNMCTSSGSSLAVAFIVPILAILAIFLFYLSRKMKPAHFVVMLQSAKVGFDKLKELTSPSGGGDGGGGDDEDEDEDDEDDGASGLEEEEEEEENDENEEEMKSEECDAKNPKDSSPQDKTEVGEDDVVELADNENNDIDHALSKKGVISSAVVAITEKGEKVLEMTKTAKKAIKKGKKKVKKFQEGMDSLASGAKKMKEGVQSFEKIVGVKIIGSSFYDSVIGKLKILISAFQIVSGFPSTLSISFPTSVTALLKTLGYVNILSFNIASFACLSPQRYDYVDTLIATTMLPIAITVVFFFMYQFEVLYLKFKLRAKNNDLLALFNTEEEAYENAATKQTIMENEAAVAQEIQKLSSHYVTLFLFLTYAVLPSVSSTIVAMIPCTNVDPNNVDSSMGNNYLTADMTIDCASPRYSFGLAWALVMIFVYPIGIPALYFYCLYINKDDIMKRDEPGVEEVAVTSVNPSADVAMGSSHGLLDNTVAPARPGPEGGSTGDLRGMMQSMASFRGGAGGHSTSRIAVKVGNSNNFVTYKDLVFLHKAYEPKYWYWEIVETARRLFFTALLVATSMSANVQVVGSILMSVVFMKLYGYYKPYVDDKDDILQETAQYQVFFTLFAGLIIRTNALAGVPGINNVVSAFIIAVNVSTAALTPYLLKESNDAAAIAEDIKDKADSLVDKIISEMESIPFVKQYFPASLIKWLAKSGVFSKVRSLCGCIGKFGSRYAGDGKIHPEGVTEALSEGLSMVTGGEIDIPGVEAMNVAGISEGAVASLSDNFSPVDGKLARSPTKA